jgi:Na+-transporting methylmalonyl-CoA/oxaloacetate decarboxylase gamma subunit
VNPDFFVAVRVTVVGMILVFLTLVICALVIKALSAIFRPEPQKEEPMLPLPDPLVLEPAASAQLLADETAAVALAIAATLASSRRKVAAVVTPHSEIATERPPSTVVVLSLDPGAGTWSNAGKFKATS